MTAGVESPLLAATTHLLRDEAIDVYPASPHLLVEDSISRRVTQIPFAGAFAQ